jgi:protein-L-isoaspartate(D-aspartate) O-methyltransferase
MSQDGPPARRGRFPLRLDQTGPAPRRFVNPDPAAARAPAVPPAPPASPTRPGAPLLRPQRPLFDAAQAPARSAPAAAGLGLDSAAFRARMVERLRADGCTQPEVLRAMSRVARHRFVDTALAAQAYEDTSLPIGLGQTISKPSVVARMVGLLLQRPGQADRQSLGRVLEIGTGCGYQAAVLCQMARHVFSVERLKALHDKARDNLAPTRPDHLRLVYGDGRLGHPPNAPYDSIIAAAGGANLPPAWLDQLAPGGRLVAPVEDAGRGTQALLVVDRAPDGTLLQRWHEAVRFVPLESGTQDSGPG